MPSPLTPRRASNRRDARASPKKSPVDAGQPLGAYDNNLVRERIRQWQAQGGGVITADDIYVEEEDDPPLQKTPKHGSRRFTTPIKEQVPTRDASSTPRQQSRRQEEEEAVQEKSRPRSISAPRKRVVSDGHWRKKRSPPKTNEKLHRKEAPSSSAKKTQDDGIRAKAVPDESPDQPPTRKASAQAKKSYADDGIRVYSTPPSSRRQSQHLRPPTEGSSDKEISGHENESYRSVSPAPPRSVGSRESERLGADHAPQSARTGSSAIHEAAKNHSSTRRKSKNPELSPRSAQGAFSEVRDSKKSSKGLFGQVLDGSKRIFSKQENAPPPPPDISAVEAWLNGTDPSDDPFIEAEAPKEDVIDAIAEEPPEDEPPKDEPPVEVPKPLRTSRRKRRSAEKPTVEDPNKIWDSLDTRDSVRSHDKRSMRRRRAHTTPVHEDQPALNKHEESTGIDERDLAEPPMAKGIDDVQKTPDSTASPASPASPLRRRGAHRSSSHSPKKEERKSSTKVTPKPVEEASNVSSTRTASSVEPYYPGPPLRPPGLGNRRPFPSVGLHRLSTIASVETFNTKSQDVPTQSVSGISEATEMPKADGNDDVGSKARDGFDPDSMDKRPSKSRLTRHADLISVLSAPKAGGNSIRSARSIRTNRSQLATATIGDIMSELATDENKYMRELRTLVDGVIPVLLTCVLSKSDSAVAAGLFRSHSTAKNEPVITKPIVDMGIALERLKILHKRAPLENPDNFLTWAQGAQRVYAEYLKAWRLGFQDVVVNLAGATDDQKSDLSSTSTKLDGALPRNDDGDVVGNHGERVDVAFLLKRPLVRLKYLAKTLKGINVLKPSTEAENLATKYQDLVSEARNRSNEERARLEDEAAANIDPTRSRDPRTLGPLSDVAIEKARRVRARDMFNLTLLHTSGQRIDCRVELLLRDDEPDKGTSGDILICEVDGTGRWLLFPPILLCNISARNGDSEGEIVVMIRGLHSDDQEWHELLSLKSDDEQTGFEWVQMIGLIPVPPKIMRMESFINRSERRKTLAAVSAKQEASSAPATPSKSRTPSPREIDVPFGEHAIGKVKKWIEQSVTDEESSAPSPSPRQRARLQKRLPLLPSSPLIHEPFAPAGADEQQDMASGTQDTTPKAEEPPRTPRSLNEALGLAGKSEHGLKRTTAKRRSRHIGESPRSPISPSSPRNEVDEHRPASFSSATKFEGSRDSLDRRTPSPAPLMPPKASAPGRPSHRRSKSSVPSLDLPTIPKIRKDSLPQTPIKDPGEDLEWPVEKQSSPKPTKPSNELPLEPTDTPPVPPPHRTPSPVQIQGPPAPDLGSGARKLRRRSSSPLKHEYEPSTASESPSDSEVSTVEHNEISSVSDSSSEDEDMENGDVPTPLLPVAALQRTSKRSPPNSLPSLPNGTLGPSSSASQAPYKTVPAQPNKAAKAIASIFFWSDKGSWDHLHPDECSIVVSPGLIEAFEMSSAHSYANGLDASSLQSPRPSSQECPDARPLIALELTPLVPIRRGTALDISIRSPPTTESKIKIIANNNIMFRSRSPEECESLYALINYSRINNPTYIALQNARITSFTPQFGGAAFDRSASTRGSARGVSSWFGLGRRSSYRASSAPTPSISKSESSIGSMASAFSALKRFGQGGSRFSIARSTVTSRDGSRANSIYTSSDNSSGSGTSTPLPLVTAGGQDGKDASAPIGLSNAKIRLYIRETASKWRDLGSARLTIMRPTNASHPLAPAAADGADKSPPSGVLSNAGGGANGPGLTGSPGGPGSNDKRIVVIGKAKGETLLDVTLGETCFERVARTGIAVSVWVNFEDGLVAKEGGVAGGTLKVFMIQVSLNRLTLMR